jgi:hypothetical protein
VNSAQTGASQRSRYIVVVMETIFSTLDRLLNSSTTPVSRDAYLSRCHSNNSIFDFFLCPTFTPIHHPKCQDSAHPGAPQPPTNLLLPSEAPSPSTMTPSVNILSPHICAVCGGRTRQGRIMRSVACSRRSIWGAAWRRDLC